MINNIDSNPITQALNPKNLRKFSETQTRIKVTTTKRIVRNKVAQSYDELHDVLSINRLEAHPK